MENEKEMTDAEMAAKDQVANEGGGINYPANRVQEHMKRLQEEGKVDASGADLIFWAYSYAREKGLSYTGVSGVLGVSGTAFWHLIRGDYSAKYDSMIEKLTKAKKMIEERSKGLSLGFVKTWAAEKIFEVCSAALYDGMPAFVYGSSQTGKTTALLEFQRTHNHGTTKYVRMGVRWSKRRVVRELARVCGCFCETAHSCDLEERIYATLNNRILLIVDEFHLALETTTDLAAKEVVEFIREVYDRTGCGLVICGTKVAEAGLETGKNRLLFDQLRRRGLVKLVLPDMPKKTDVNRFAKEFSLEAPAGETYEFIRGILQRFGLGMFVKYLQKSYAYAKSQKRPLSWDVFTEVANGYADLAKENKNA